jgi:hypothetical protein
MRFGLSSGEIPVAGEPYDAFLVEEFFGGDGRIRTAE